jgi:hypothetical protein
LADRSIKHPYGVVKDLLVKVDKFILPADFVVLDMDANERIPLILGRPFLATGRALIDVEQGELMLRVQEEKVTFNVLDSIRYPSDRSPWMKVDVLDELLASNWKKDDYDSILEDVIANSRDFKNKKELSQEAIDCLANLESNSSTNVKNPPIEHLVVDTKINKDPKLEL